VNFLEWRRNDGRFWAEVDQFPSSNHLSVFKSWQERSTNLIYS
jgi:hypothetical protein